MNEEYTKGTDDKIVLFLAELSWSLDNTSNTL